MRQIWTWKKFHHLKAGCFQRREEEVALQSVS